MEKDRNPLLVLLLPALTPRRHSAADPTWKEVRYERS